MKKYVYMITTPDGDDYKVWVKATSKADAEQQVRSEYWDIADLTLISVE